MLVVSNVFMTIVWHGHLKHPQRSLGLVILARWGIAFFEYCLMVPANRWGSQTYSAFQMKAIEELVTLVVFIAFAFLYFGPKPRWNHVAAFLCIFGAVAFMLLPGK